MSEKVEILKEAIKRIEYVIEISPMKHDWEGMFKLGLETAIEEINEMILEGDAQ